MANHFGSGYVSDEEEIDMAIWACLDGVKPHNGLLREGSTVLNPTPAGWHPDSLDCPFIPITKAGDLQRRQTAKRNENRDKRRFVNNFQLLKRAGKTHFKNVNIQSLSEKAERCRLQAFPFLLYGTVSADTVSKLVKVLPQVRNNPANLSLAIQNSNKNQSAWKILSLRWATEAAYEVVESSGGIEKFEGLSPEQRIAIWEALFMEAPGIISEYAMAGVRDAVNLKAIWHAPAAEEKWRKLVKTQVVRMLDMAWMYRVRIGVWNTKIDSRRKEKDLSTVWLLRTTEMGDIYNLKQIPSHADRQVGRSRSARPGHVDGPLLQGNNDDL